MLRWMCISVFKGALVQVDSKVLHCFRLTLCPLHQNNVSFLFSSYICFSRMSSDYTELSPNINERF